MVHPLYAVMAFTCALVSVLISAGVLGGLDKNNISDKKFIILTRWTVSFCCMDGIWGLFASHILCNDTILLILSSLNHICAAFTAVGWLSFVLSYLNIRKKTERISNFCRCFGIDTGHDGFREQQKALPF